MEVERLRSSLRRYQRVALDTSVFIYHLEANPSYLALSDCVFSWLESEDSRAVTSVFTLAELLVKPYREADQQSAQKCYALLSTFPNINWIAPSLSTAHLAARIRAIHRLRTPDAFQAATAVEAHVQAMLTNDRIFKRVPNLEVLVLDDYL